MGRDARLEWEANSGHYPANTQRGYNVVTTLLQLHDVAATLLRRCVFAVQTTFVCLHVPPGPGSLVIRTLLGLL